MARPDLTRRAMLAGLAVVGANLLLPWRLLRAGEVVRVMKVQGCGCCEGWAEHLRAAGFVCEVSVHPDLDAYKAELGVPADLRSCHTATVAGYIVEGHVPATAVQRLLAGRPALAGLAVPGMPAGSPGMPSDRPETYEVTGFARDGSRVPFMRFVGDASI